MWVIAWIREGCVQRAERAGGSLLFGCLFARLVGFGWFGACWASPLAPTRQLAHSLAALAALALLYACLPLRAFALRCSEMPGYASAFMHACVRAFRVMGKRGLPHAQADVAVFLCDGRFFALGARCPCGEYARLPRGYSV